MTKTNFPIITAKGTLSDYNSLTSRDVSTVYFTLPVSVPSTGKVLGGDLFLGNVHIGSNVKDVSILNNILTIEDSLGISTSTNLKSSIIGSASVGSSTLPIYINAGNFAACSSTLGVGITGNAATANKVNHKLTFTTAANSSFDGSSDISIAIPMVYVKGTQVGTTNTWTGNAPTISELVDGLTINYLLPYSGNGNPVTLTLTLSDNSSTGAIACYAGSGSNNRITTHYPQGSSLILTYHNNLTIGSSSYTGWWVNASYYRDNSVFVRYHSKIKASGNISYGYLIVGDSNGYKNLNNSSTFDIQYPILRSGYTVSSGNYSINNFSVMYNILISTTGTTGFTGVYGAAVYLKGILTGTTFTIDDANFVTCTVPITDDGYYYYYVGLCGSTSISTEYLHLDSNHPIYKYYNGKFQLWTEGITNTAGSTNTDNKIYLVGATTQQSYVQTYSDVSTYTQNGNLHSDVVTVAEKVSVVYDSSTSSINFIFN